MVRQRQRWQQRTASAAAASGLLCFHSPRWNFCLMNLRGKNDQGPGGLTMLGVVFRKKGEESIVAHLPGLTVFKSKLGCGLRNAGCFLLIRGLLTGSRGAAPSWPHPSKSGGLVLDTRERETVGSMSWLMYHNPLISFPEFC